MRRRTRLEITVETSLRVIRRARTRDPIWCPACSSPALPFPPEEAAELAGVGTRAVYRWLEAGRLHLFEAAEQAPLICLTSLLRSIGEGDDAHETKRIPYHRNHDRPPTR